MLKKMVLIFCIFSLENKLLISAHNEPTRKKKLSKEQSNCSTHLKTLISNLKNKMFEALEQKNILVFKTVTDIKNDIIYYLEEETDDSPGGYTAINYLTKVFSTSSKIDILIKENQDLFEKIKSITSHILNTEKKVNALAWKQNPSNPTLYNMCDNDLIESSNNTFIQYPFLHNLITIYEALVQRHILQEVSEAKDFSKDTRFKSKEEKEYALTAIISFFELFLNHLEDQIKKYGSKFQDGLENLQTIVKMLQYKKQELIAFFGEETMQKIFSHKLLLKNTRIRNELGVPQVPQRQHQRPRQNQPTKLMSFNTINRKQKKLFKA